MYYSFRSSSKLISTTVDISVFFFFSNFFFFASFFVISSLTSIFFFCQQLPFDQFSHRFCQITSEPIGIYGFLHIGAEFKGEFGAELEVDRVKVRLELAKSDKSIDSMNEIFCFAVMVITIQDDAGMLLKRLFVYC